jgi:molybdopterin synthase catalytic subunit
MQVRVLCFGVLKDITGQSEAVLQIPAGTTVSEVFDRLCEQHATLRERRPSILFANNGEFVKSAAILAEGDEVAFLPPVSGGSGGKHRVEITRDPIDSSALLHELQRAEDGALIVFEGIVRNHSGGKRALYLDYECYEPLALRQMQRIADECSANWPVGRIGIIHRLGRLQVGEVSVCIVVTAPHRKAAYEASYACINRLKQEVPVWKKEHFEDGSVWVEGEWADALRSAPEGG